MMQATEDKLIKTFKHQLMNTETLELKDRIEKAFIIAVMEVYMHNQTSSAKALGMNRGTLRARLKKYGLINSRRA